MDSLKRYPADVELGPLSKRVFDVLAGYTSFPWPILRAQCERHRVDPTQLTEASLPRVIPDVATGVARFTNPEKGELVRQALEALLGPSERAGA